MPLKPVAKEGEVTATAGTVLYSPATSGSWSAGSVTETAYAFLTIGGVAVVHQASCTFSFSGSDNSSGTAVPVSGTSPVTLTAAPTTLQKGTTNVLRDGDSAQDTYGNKLAVSAANNLRSD